MFRAAHACLLYRTDDESEFQLEKLKVRAFHESNMAWTSHPICQGGDMGSHGPRLAAENAEENL